MNAVIAVRENRTAVGVRRLLRSRRARWEQGLYVVEGERFVAELLQQGRECSLLAIVPDLVGHEGFQTEARTVVFSPEVMASVSALEAPSRALAVFSMNLTDPESLRECDRVLVPLSVQDPGNLGTMVRSLAAFSYRGALLVSPGTVDPFSPKVVRAAAGAFGVVKVASFHDPLVLLSEIGLHSLGLMRGGGAAISSSCGRDSLAVVVGAEGLGIAADDRVRLDEVVEIPQLSGDSLNAGMAVAIALFCVAPGESYHG